MPKQANKRQTQKIISTKLSTNYSIILQDGKLVGILVENAKESNLYYFNPKGNQLKVTNLILKKALEAFLRSNTFGFDTLYVLFCELRYSEYMSIAETVFKNYWNELYNLAIADTIFKREVTFDNLNKTYNFFEENK